MKFPTHVYRSPGTHQGVGGTYDYRRVCSEEEAEAAAKAGWYPSPVLAIEGGDVADAWAGMYAKAKKAPEPKTELDAAKPSRIELELKASMLGIEFTDSTRDSTLIKKIAEAEAA